MVFTFRNFKGICIFIVSFVVIFGALYLFFDLPIVWVYVFYFVLICTIIPISIYYKVDNFKLKKYFLFLKIKDLSIKDDISYQVIEQIHFVNRVKVGESGEFDDINYKIYNNQNRLILTSDGHYINNQQMPLGEYLKREYNVKSTVNKIFKTRET